MLISRFWSACFYIQADCEAVSTADSHFHVQDVYVVFTPCWKILSGAYFCAAGISLMTYFLDGKLCDTYFDKEPVRDGIIFCVRL